MLTGHHWIGTLVRATALLCAIGCKRGAAPRPATPSDELDVALAPPAIVAALRKLGGGHVHGTATWKIQPLGQDGTSPSDAVTTTTDLWIDSSGNFRLTETNDRDGGREVILAGHELAVALRHGKLMRRPATESESSRFLHEAIGAPVAAWEILRRAAAVQKTDAPDATTYRINRSQPHPVPTAGLESPLRKWRDTIVVASLSGEIRLEPRTRAPLFVSAEAHFSARRSNEPIEGDLLVNSAVDGIGHIDPVVMPATAETLAPRQRTILDERALLDGLARDPPPSPAPTQKRIVR